ncbi:SSV1 integrase homolog, N-fragment [Edwardsiella piscicida]|nr:SSV1 integrase homolog, N-fragment [Edwardsiella piscicida]
MAGRVPVMGSLSRGRGCATSRTLAIGADDAREYKAKEKWCVRVDSNYRPPPCQGGALTN